MSIPRTDSIKPMRHECSNIEDIHYIFVYQHLQQQSLVHRTEGNQEQPRFESRGNVLVPTVEIDL